MKKFFLFLTLLTLSVGQMWATADHEKTDSWDFSTSGNDAWSSTNCGSYCGGWGKNKNAAPSVSKSNISDFSSVNFSNHENVSLTIYVTAAHNSGTNSYTVTLIDSNENKVSNYQLTKTDGMGSGSNASSARESSLTFTPTQAFSGYKIEFYPKSFITQTRYVLTYDDKSISCSTPPTVGTNLTSVSATANSITATVPISSIGGCNITENGLVYSTTTATPTVGGSGCTKVTTTACGATAANKTVTISELTCGTTYYVRGYATNAAGTSYTNVTTQSTSACPKYTVTLKDDDTELEQATAGASVTLPTRSDCPSQGFTFAGWTKSWTSAQSSWTTIAPTIINAGNYTPQANESLYPVYTKTEGSGTTDVTVVPGTYTNKGSGNYGSGAERTGTVSTISFGGHYITGNAANSPVNPCSAGTYLQCQAANANIYNKTAMPGNITRVVVNQYAAQNIDLYCGTSQLMASDNTSTGQTPSGTAQTAQTAATQMTWNVSGNYKFFDLKKGSGTSYITSIVITYANSTTSYISEKNCCTSLGQINGSFFVSNQ